MVDPTFNREKAEAVLRQWWSAYGVNQAPVNANTQRPDFADQPYSCRATPKEVDGSTIKIVLLGKLKEY